MYRRFRLLLSARLVARHSVLPRKRLGGLLCLLKAMLLTAFWQRSPPAACLAMAVRGEQYLSPSDSHRIRLAVGRLAACCALPVLGGREFRCLAPLLPRLLR
jgi:hypothetical protein